MNAEWLHWYYLIYLLPAAVAVLVLLMSGLGGHHGGHAHAGHGGLHLHAHHGVSHLSGAGHSHAGHVHGGGHTADGHTGPPAAAHGHGSHSAHHGEHVSPSLGRQLLGFFGIGRVPLTLVVGSLMIGWGLFGLGATELLRPILRFPVLFVGPSMGIAGIGAVLSAKLFGELAARVMPSDESFAISREGLLGLTGQVVYPVSETSGRVHVFDQHRTLHVEPARVLQGQAVIPKGTDVIVASIDPDRGYLLVEPLGFTRDAVSTARVAGTRPAALASDSAEESVEAQANPRADTIEVRANEHR